MEPRVTSSRRPWRARTTSCRRSWTWLSPFGLAVRLRLAGLRVLDRREARLEGGHQVGDLLRLLVRRLDRDLLAVGLGLDQLEHLLAVLVVVLRGLEVRRQRVDQLLGHLELAVRGLEVLGRGHVVEVVGRHDLVVEDHRLHRQHVALAGADRDELLLGAQHDAGDRHLAGLAHRLEQQAVGLPRALVGDEVVRVVVEDRVDVLEVDEVLDVDRAGLLGGDRVELLGRDHDVALLGQLEALDDLLVRDLLVGHGVHALLGDAVARVGVELVEADGLARDRRVELDGHVDEPEGDRAAPDRPWHRPIVTKRRRPHAELRRARRADPRARTSASRRSTRSWRAGSRPPAARRSRAGRPAGPRAPTRA